MVVAETKFLVEEAGIPPAEIVILSPFLSDALRFSVMNRLEAAGIPSRSHRPSRSLRDETACQALITLAALAHPEWNIHPPHFDIAYALMQSIDGLDLVRAQLLADIVYRPRELRLSTFDNINPDVQERITFRVGNRYTTLRDWLLAYREGKSCLSIISSESCLVRFCRRQALDSTHFDSVRVAGSLVESVKNFRQALESTYLYQADGARFPHLGKEYIPMLEDGVIAASYVEAWRSDNKDAVLVSPAHSFLMMNRPVTYQFWLDPGSSGWYERLSQPLTHPYVLTREWEPGRIWSDADEVQSSKRDGARRLGSSARCRERVYLGFSDLGESGFEQRGELLRAFQKVLQTTDTR